LQTKMILRIEIAGNTLKVHPKPVILISKTLKRSNLLKLTRVTWPPLNPKPIKKSMDFFMLINQSITAEEPKSIETVIFLELLLKKMTVKIELIKEQDIEEHWL
jgi:hypothetical protein